MVSLNSLTQQQTMVRSVGVIKERRDQLFNQLHHIETIVTSPHATASSVLPAYLSILYESSPIFGTGAAATVTPTTPSPPIINRELADAEAAAIAPVATGIATTDTITRQSPTSLSSNASGSYFAAAYPTPYSMRDV
jgi:hypothetical protein